MPDQKLHIEDKNDDVVVNVNGILENDFKLNLEEVRPSIDFVPASKSNVAPKYIAPKF